ncbi:MAG TPA: hypothetical protein VGR88_07370, partial [Ktedonobacterales bacterium]|nr:hypothetical protein [Ktedonobacterales bacterium]
MGGVTSGATSRGRKRSAQRLARLVGFIAIVCALAAFPHATRAAGLGRLYAQNPCTPVYASADTHSTLLTQLIGGSDVTGVGTVSAAGTAWEQARIWSGVEGFIPSDQIGAQPPRNPSEGACMFPGLPDTPSATIPADTGPVSFAHHGVVSSPATIYARPDDGSLPVTAAPVGATLDTHQWTADASGRPWYQVSASGVTGWIWAANVALDAPNPATRTVNGRPIWAPVAGKGMWFTNYLAHHSDMDTLMRAAKLAGVTHIYAEVAITQYGFYGADSLDRLLPAAHKAGIAVIAWVYPTLNDIGADLRMTEAVLQYVGPGGERPDGYATDVEEVDDSASVYSYGEVVRALVGPDSLLVAAVFHPYAQAYYPYAAVAASWNVLAPMDYWHSRGDHAYSPQEVSTFVANSLTTIRASMSALGTRTPLPIEELGQTYDMYSADGVDLGSGPTGGEVTADLATARAYGCIGASFFEWQTTSQAE